MTYQFKKRAKDYIKDENKSKRIGDCPEVSELIKEQLNRIENYIREKSVYQIGQICCGFDHYLDDKQKEVVDQTHYERGEIIWVDFGCMNIGCDFEYPHPAVVISETNYHVLIAPCSSKKYSYNIPEIMKVGVQDGFKTNTGILLDSIAFVSKNKVINRLDGKADEKTMLKIDKYRLQNNEYYRRIVKQYDKEIKELEKKEKELLSRLVEKNPI